MNIKSNAALAFKMGLIFMFIIMTLFSCKKGKEDPLLTLRSRKARLSGTWVLVQGELHKNDKIIRVDNYQLTSSDNAETEKCVWKLEINPNGAFIETIALYRQGNDSPYNTSILFGNWAFLKANEEYQKKEIVEFTYRLETPIEDFVTGSNAGSSRLSYPVQRSKLIGLHNNKLHMEFEKSEMYDAATLRFERLKGGGASWGAIFY